MGYILVSQFIKYLMSKRKAPTKQKSVIKTTIDDDSRENKIQLSQHSAILFEEYKGYEFRNPKPVKMGWEQYLSKFKYHEEFLQHLETGISKYMHHLRL